MWPFTNRTKLKINVVTRDPIRLRLNEWQSDENLTSAAQKVLLDPTFNLMLQVARNENPSLIHLNMDAQLETRALHQARIEGYNLALRNFEVMAIHEPIKEELIATFEPEERQ